MKLVASDLSRFQRETWIENLVVAPAERYVVDVRFEGGGSVVWVNDIQGLDHIQGRFFPETDTLGVVTVGGGPVSPDFSESFEQLRHNQEVSSEVEAYRPFFDGPVDHTLRLGVQPVSGSSNRLPIALVNFIQIDTVYFPPVEWNDAMPDMNWLATTENLRWIIRDEDSGDENMEIDWRFQVGDVIKLRIFNDPEAFHPMQHPIHIHGQRFLVLEQDGVPRTNFVWKDTAIVPTGSTLDLLVEMSNPGEWMLHCHILEHAGADMMMVFGVDEAPDG